MDIFGTEYAGILAQKVALSAIVVIAGFFGIWLSRSFIRKWAGRFASKKIDTIKSMLVSVSKYVIYFIMGTIILTIFGVGGNSIVLAVTGIGSVAIGFASQSLVKDVITGTTILLSDQFNVGDIISVGTLYTGEVVSLGLGNTKIRAANGDLYIIPNSEIKVVTKVNIDSANEHLYRHNAGDPDESAR